jgi:hypothetical protein
MLSEDDTNNYLFPVRLYSPLPCEIEILKIKGRIVQSNQANAEVNSIDRSGLRLLSALRFPPDAEFTLRITMQKAWWTFAFEGTIVAEESSGGYTSYDVAFAQNEKDRLHMLRFVAWLASPNIPDYLRKLETYHFFSQQQEDPFRKKVDLLL